MFIEDVVSDDITTSSIVEATRAVRVAIQVGINEELHLHYCQLQPLRMLFTKNQCRRTVATLWTAASSSIEVARREAFLSTVVALNRSDLFILFNVSSHYLFFLQAPPPAILQRSLAPASTL